MSHFSFWAHDILVGMTDFVFLEGTTSWLSREFLFRIFFFRIGGESSISDREIFKSRQVFLKSQVGNHSFHIGERTGKSKRERGSG